MAHDYNKKEPSKTERALYEIAMFQQVLERRQLTNSAHILAMGILLNVDPKKIAELLTSKEDEIKKYGEEVNKYITEFEEKLQKEEKPEEKQD